MAKNTRGFTLLEVVVSITVLALTSVFILQMFVVSDNVNKKARDIDNANMVCMAAVESFKNGTQPYGAFGEYEEFYYDGNWDITGLDAAYMMRVFVSRGDADIYNIETYVYACGPDNTAELASISATRYFGARTGVNR